MFQLPPRLSGCEAHLSDNMLNSYPHSQPQISTSLLFLCQWKSMFCSFLISLSEVRSDLWIVRCNDFFFFAVFVCFPVLISWLLRKPPAFWENLNCSFQGSVLFQLFNWYCCLSFSYLSSLLYFKLFLKSKYQTKDKYCMVSLIRAIFKNQIQRNRE